MHLGDLASYEQHAKRSRPAWWPATADKAPRLPEATDTVITLKQPVPIREGDIVGYIGEDVPASMRSLAKQPASRPLLHLELFSGDDVPAYLARSRQWANEHLPDSERTLLVLRKGDTLHKEANGAVAFTLNRPQVLPLAGMEVREVDGKRWRKVAKLSGDGGAAASGWVLEEGRLASPWEWPGFEVHDEASTSGGFRHNDAPAFAAYIRQEGPRPPDSPFYQKLGAWLDSNRDGEVDEKELDWALRNRSVAGMLARLVVRHESEWSRAYSAARQATAHCVAEQLGPNTLQCIQDEIPRAEKLPWWDDVAAGVAGFPQSTRVYHLHPGGLAGNFAGMSVCACNRDITLDEIRMIVSDELIRTGLFPRSAYPAVRCTPADVFVRMLNTAMEDYEITDCLDKAHFLANLAVECDRFKTTEEYKNRGGVIPSHWYNYSGGADYHGRGLIQLTHDYNYQKYFRSAGLSLSTPSSDVASDLSLATDSACWFWRHGSAWGDLSGIAKKNDFLFSVLGVNGGFNHAAEREGYVLKLIEKFGTKNCSTNKGKVVEKYRFSKSGISQSKVGSAIWKRYFGDTDELP
ncbi:glycoside hydrolase family 19 protein [Lysobacter arvi]|uniref:Glycoside hydrolase family 19 protein n=1 Tax=Lysobacter arvi TaxID=3038776 RepID=A0ABU1CD91_9GAMM|nr:glycoside hydrolase family 19 protein [Lysobacter arvi]MDR0182135.1 glycoside hydrolase family 19 protein [Lysobacter arvi]